VGEDHAGARARRSSPTTTRRPGLTPYLDKLGFNLVGYGCTTCIGNSGPLPPEVSRRSTRRPRGVSVLSGNRNFEGRINPDVKMNYLASPPLVVAYALAGTMDIDLTTEPLGTDPTATTVYLRTSGRRRRRSTRPSTTRSIGDMFTRATPTCSPATSAGRAADAPPATRSSGTPTRPTCASRRTSTACRRRRSPVTDIAGARVLAKLGDSVTTDHISPGRLDQGRQPGRASTCRARRRAQGLQLLRLAARQPRGDDPRHVRQHPAAQPARSRHRGRLHPRLHAPTARRRRHLRRVAALPAERVPLVVLAGKEYGSGSSRDWAAKGTALLGVRPSSPSRTSASTART
jgi:aconitate hydratase